jgi:hypothetical protein
MKWKCFIILLVLFAKDSFAQISGVINIYTPVTAMDLTCNKVTVASTAGFATGDRVLMIQMQGAVIDQTNAATFGNLTGTGIAGAGNYEFAVILGISGNDIYFKNKILYSNYDPVNGSIQLISVPQYTDITISGVLTANAWDGSTGGVLVFEASGIVTLNANIDVNGLGFRGGNPTNPGTNSTTCYDSQTSTYYYALSSIYAGEKGEGATKYITGKESGRGKNLNGGGGGQSHNSGGGGGGNYGAGGRGGDVATTCDGFLPATYDPFGLGALGFTNTYYNNVSKKIFLGGGGAGGQQNNNTSFPGANGGGIVIIRAGTIAGNNFTVNAQGMTAATNTLDGGDGAGGGGSGGTILIQAGSYSSNITADVRGGTGGGTNAYGSASNKDFGPGGGGGGGAIWVSQAALPAQVTASLTAGAAGISAYSNTNYAATAGVAGAALTNLALSESATLFTPACIATPVELISFEAKQEDQYVRLEWSTASEKNNLYFLVEKSSDLSLFEIISKVAGAGNSGIINDYNLLDKNPNASFYYRLSQVDLNGDTKILGIRHIDFSRTGSLDFNCYPNPFNENLNLEFNSGKSGKIYIQVIDIIGTQVYSLEADSSKKIILPFASLPSGIYTIIASDGYSQTLKKVIHQL